MINTASYSPYGSTNGSSGVDDFLKKYQLAQQTQQPAQTPTPISELDGYLSSLPSDKRNAVEMSPEYQHRKLRLFDKFITYAIAMTPDGNTFLGTPAGRKLAQDLLDSAQNIANNYENESRNELNEMKDLIKKQADKIEALQSELEEQKLIFDFSKSPDTKSKKDVKSAVVVSHKKDTEVRGNE